MATQQQLESFHRFAAEQLQKGAGELSMSDLVDLWELKNLPADQLDENAAAIQASIDDMLAGETGRDAADVLRDLREQLNHSMNP